VVFLVSVQCGGVTEDFEADCTITDNINKIVRRLRLSSSKPFGESLESNLFESQEVDKTINEYTESDLSEYSDESESMNQTVVKEKKRSTINKVMIGQGRNYTKKLILKMNESKYMDEKCAVRYEKLADNNDLDIQIQREDVPTLSNHSSALKNNSNKCERTQEPRIMTPENVTTRLDKNKAKQKTLLLPSCSYVDLTAVQASCGPGYKAMVDKLQQHLLHSIFFDSSSGHIIYAVHEDKRWQCCKTRKNLTKDVECTMGTKC